jgi:hypothetical protein
MDMEKLSLDKVEKVIGGKGSLSGCLTARTCRVRFYLFRPTQNRMSTR